MWPVLCVATAVSLQLQTTMSVWHAFDSPNGNFYRQAFVLAGMLVVTGWVSAAAGTRRAAPLVVPAVLVIVGYLLVLDGQFLTPATRVVVPVLVLVTLLTWPLVSKDSPEGGRLGALALAGLVLAVVVEGVASSAAIEDRRLVEVDATEQWGDRHDRARALVLEPTAGRRTASPPGTSSRPTTPCSSAGRARSSTRARSRR